MNAQRLKQVRAKMKENDLDLVLVNSPANRRWLTGFTGSAGSVVIGLKQAFLLVDARYVVQAQSEAPLFEQQEIVDIHQSLQTIVTDWGVRRAGFESNHIVHQRWQQLTVQVDGCQWVAMEDWLEQLRGVKDDSELTAIEKAVAIADEAFAALLPLIRPGVSELAIAWELEKLMREAGAQRLAFDTIVASGVRGALPHGRPSEKLLADGELITFDFGAVFAGYHSDITRTVALGKVDAEQKKIYDIVRQAQQAGVEAVQVGATGQQVDQVARDVIVAAGYGQFFGHGLGHGIGLEVHESYPRLSRLGKASLVAGMVCSVEPGIYIPGWGGIRIEDLVCVAEGGARILTQTTKELLIL